MVEERITTQAGHGWNLLMVSTPRVCMTGAVPATSTADSDRRALGFASCPNSPAPMDRRRPLGFGVGPAGPLVEPAFLGHLARKKKQEWGIDRGGE